jgi:uncharacterized protein (DUF58 family)
MRPRSFALLGLVLLLLSTPYFLLALSAVLAEDTLAVSLCPDSCKDADLAATVPRRVLGEHDSMPITAVLSTARPTARTVEVTIRAEAFTTSPPETTRTVTVTPGQETRISWLVTPKTEGVQTVSVAIKDQGYIYSLQVAPIPLLTGEQAQFLSYAALILGSLLLLFAAGLAVRARWAGRRAAASGPTRQPTPLI